MSTERWLPVVGSGGWYDVSDQGRVRSWRTLGGASRAGMRRREPLLLKLVVNNRGYLEVGVTTRHKKVGVHRLVLAAFVGPCPDGLEVRHLNGNPLDNSLANLRYGTRAENVQDQLRHGTHRHAFQTRCKRGHEYKPETTYVSSAGHRTCLICRRVMQNARNRRVREQAVA